MKRYRVTQTVKIDGVKYPAGTVVEEAEVAANIASMVRLGQAVELQRDGTPVPSPPLPPDEVPLPPEPADQAADVPQIVLQLDGGTEHVTESRGTIADPAPSGPLVGPPGEVPTQAPEQPKVEQKHDPKRKK